MKSEIETTCILDVVFVCMWFEHPSVPVRCRCICVVSHVSKNDIKLGLAPLQGRRACDTGWRRPTETHTAFLILDPFFGLFPQMFHVVSAWFAKSDPRPTRACS